MEIALLFFILFMIFGVWLMFRAAKGVTKFTYRQATKGYRAREEKRVEQEQRQQSVVRARRDPHPFVMDASVRINGEEYLKKKRFDELAGFIKGRALYFQERTQDAVNLVNDEIERLEIYRAELGRTIIDRYDAFISRYRNDISHAVFADERASLEYQDKLKIELPEKPKAFQKELRTVGKPLAKPFNMAMNSQYRAVGVGVVLAAGLVQLALAHSKMRRQLREELAKLEVFAQEAYTAMQAIETVDKHIATVREMHEGSARTVTELADQVYGIVEDRQKRELSTGSFYDLVPEEQEIFERFYFEGERLKKIVSINFL
jgi:hypothetical protein